MKRTITLLTLIAIGFTSYATQHAVSKNNDSGAGSMEYICIATNGTDTRTECNSCTWIDGNTYTTNNNIATYNIVGGAANGCDSLVTLDLTIINSSAETDTRTECNSYTWIDGNNYTASNNSATFNIVGGAANGCDSLVMLDLTIANSTSGTDVIDYNAGAKV